jgi:hypothetical protein
MYDIIKARLERGAEMKVGELRLIIVELVKTLKKMEAEIETLKQAVNAKPRGGRSGSKDADSGSDLQD